MSNHAIFIRGAVIALALSCSCAALRAEGSDDFTHANKEYGAGHFREAAELYEGVAKSGQSSAALFYNLGNARFRAGDLGRAILNYERALALDPHHPEADANLRLAREKARALELRKTWWDRAASWTTPSFFCLAAMASFWIAAFSIAASSLAPRRSRAATGVFILALIVFTVAIGGVYAFETGSHGRGLAIVTADKIEARLATADNAGTVLVLPPGSEVKILSTRGGWAYAILPNELRGWIPAQSAESVRL